MSGEKTDGKLRGSYYETIQVEWEIADFLSQVGTERFDEHDSPVFSFAENTWKLRLSADGLRSPPLLLLRVINVRSHKDKKLQVTCELGLKKADGCVKPFVAIKNIFSTFQSGRAHAVIDREENLRSNKLTMITCTLKRNITHSAQPYVSHELASLKLIKLDTLSEDFKNLFIHKDNCDVTLQVKEKAFQAHKTVLMARSSVFASMFHHDTSENQTGIVNIPDCDPDSFQEFLEFLYCGKLENFSSFHSALHLYKTSDKYNVQELKYFCVEYMEQYLADDNVCDVIVLADLYDESKLLSAAQGFFNKNANKITETTQWESLMKNNYRLANKLIKEALSKLKV